MDFAKCLFLQKKSQNKFALICHKQKQKVFKQKNYNDTNELEVILKRITKWIINLSRFLKVQQTQKDFVEKWI